MGSYQRKTTQRPYEERSFSVRDAHRNQTDLHKLAEVEAAYNHTNNTTPVAF